MTLPMFIAFDSSSYEESGFPVSVTWSLTSGELKTSLIYPEDEWLEQEDDLCRDIDPERLYQEGHSVKMILKELLEDLHDQPLYTPDPYLSEQCLEKLNDALDNECDLPLRATAELFADISAEERELCRTELITLLDLDDHRAEAQVRLWLQMYVRLQGEETSL